MALDAEKNQLSSDSQRTQGKITLALAVTAFIASFGNSFTHGFHSGVLNSPATLIREFLNNSYKAHYGETKDTTINFLWSFTVAIYLVGGCAGAFLAGFFAERFGRKKALILMTIPGFIGCALFGFCKLANSLEMLIIGRLVMGLSCGAGSGLVPMYLTEIAPVNIRGAMGVLHQLALTIGILVAQVLGLREVLGNDDLWPLLLAISAVAFATCAVGLPFFPDSPRYLLVKRGDAQGAESALKRFRGQDDVSADIADMQTEAKQQQQEPAWTLRKLFRSRALTIPLMLVSVLAVAQQLSGINTVFYYSDQVFRSANIPAESTQYATLGTGGINVLMTIISVPLMEKAGRRSLLLVGMAGMSIMLVVETVALVLQHEYHWLSYVSVACTILFVISFAIGLGSIPQFIGAELFKSGPRPAAMSFAGLLNWAANFLVAMSFPGIQAAVGPYSMLIFLAFLIAFGIVTWKFLPETKNKTFDEIARELGVKMPGHESSLPMEPLKSRKDVDAEGGEPMSPLLRA